MKNTKRKGTLFRKTKFVEEDYEEDKKHHCLYNNNGYKNARIVSDSVYREKTETSLQKL